MVTKIVVRGTKEEVLKDLMEHKLVPASKEDWCVENPEGFPAPCVEVEVYKMNPLEKVFLKDRLGAWSHEEDTTLLKS